MLQSKEEGIVIAKSIIEYRLNKSKVLETIDHVILHSSSKCVRDACTNEIMVVIIIPITKTNVLKLSIITI